MDSQRLAKNKLITILMMLIISLYFMPRHGEALDVFETKLLASDGQASDRLGRSVAISGNRAVVGAYFDDNQRGSAYLFEFHDNEWIEVAKLTASDGTGSDRFGSPVAISEDGNTVAVGATQDDSRRGSAYVYQWDGSSWQETKLVGSQSRSGHFCGQVGVNEDGTVVLSGCPNDEPGKLYVFTFDGSGWSEAAILTASDGGRGLGADPHIQGDTIAVANHRDNSEQGAVYVFERTEATWIEQAKLTASDGAPGDLFGLENVDLNNGVIVVGAQQHDGNGLDNSGSAYVFEFNGLAWVEVTTH